jgi:ABC-2 type transport system ATP-binding protein
VLLLDEPFGGLDAVVREDLVEGLLEIAADPPCTVLVASHDMATVEKLADRVGFLHEGRLLLSQDMETIRRRFREVEVVCADPVELPAPLPPTWLRPAAAGATVRFVDSRYDAAETGELLRTAFPGLRRFTASPMSLQDIFIAMMRSSSQQRFSSMEVV